MLDVQVKIRGFRIELGEIEAVILTNEALSEAAVVDVEDSRHEKRLVAYLVLSDTSKGGEVAPEVVEKDVLEALRRRLPEYMIPSLCVFIDRLPLTANQKLDRSALPPPDWKRLLTAGPDDQEVVLATNTTEETLVYVFKEVLGLGPDRPIGTGHSFFDLGGHSIAAAYLISRVEETFGVAVPLTKVFDSPTPRDLARYVLSVMEGSGDSGDVGAVRLQDEVVLDEDLMPLPQMEDTPGAIPMDATRGTFLTGATGFLGVFILGELMRQTPLTVYCLVRAPDVKTGYARLRKTMRTYELYEDEYMARIVPIPGDLALPRFGLDEEAFEALASVTDSIYHSGSLVNFMYPFSALKAANVGGTQQVIRLACTHHNKPIHYVSTLSVFGTGKHLDRAITEDDQLAPPSDVLGGYAQSKWVSEGIMLEARRRGFLVAIYRPGRITGDTRTGVCNLDDFLFRMIKGCIQLGAYPLIMWTEKCASVDFCARAIVTLAERGLATGSNFHLISRLAFDWVTLFEWVHAYGFPIVPLEFEDWLQRLTATGKEALTGVEENAMFPLLPLLHEVGKDSVMPSFDNRNMVEGIVAVADMEQEESSLACRPLDEALLHLYMDHMVRTGFLSRPMSDADR
jgi:myxalamid-type nonribosomal peptide synthetase MxaA